jgi:hypothetical protein
MALAGEVDRSLADEAHLSANEPELRPSGGDPARDALCLPPEVPEHEFPADRLEKPSRAS